MAAIHDLTKPLAVNPRKEGEFYDDCPACGTRDIDRVHKSDREWSIYSCAPQTGGCGLSWSRAQSAMVAKREAQGKSTAWRTSSAARGRVLSTPSASYRDGFARIDWTK